MEQQRVLTQALDAYKEDILAFAKDLIRIASENPPGNYYRECVDRIRVELDRLGLVYRAIEVPGFPERPRYNLLSFFGEGQRTLYFHGHYDVVPAQDREQFTPRLEKGQLYGRGSADMKAGVAGMIYAVQLLKRCGVALNGRVGLCIVADEETGGQGGSHYLDQIGLLGQDGFAMLTPEPTSGVVWNANRGAITLRITVTGRSAAHSILMLGGRVEGGTNFNVVPETCSFTVERRFNPEEDFETEKAALFNVLEGLRGRGIALGVEVLQEGRSSGVPEDHAVAKTLAETIEAVTGKRPPFEMCPGILETRWYARKGIPAFAHGPGLLEISHGPHEGIEVERIYQHALIYALAATRLLS